MNKLQQRKAMELEKMKRVQKLADVVKESELQFERIVERLNSIK